MGETAAKLRTIFDSLAIERGVFLFDEFDALGSRRSHANDALGRVPVGDHSAECGLLGDIKRCLLKKSSEGLIA